MNHMWNRPLHPAPSSSDTGHLLEPKREKKHGKETGGPTLRGYIRQGTAGKAYQGTIRRACEEEEEEGGGIRD